MLEMDCRLIATGGFTISEISSGSLPLNSDPHHIASSLPWIWQNNLYPFPHPNCSLLLPYGFPCLFFFFNFLLFFLHFSALPFLSVVKTLLQDPNDLSQVSLEKTLGKMLGKTERAGGEGGDRGYDGWMSSPTQWTWVWASFRRWWRTGKPGLLQSMGLQRVGHDLATEQQIR